MLIPLKTIKVRRTTNSDGESVVSIALHQGCDIKEVELPLTACEAVNDAFRVIANRSVKAVEIEVS